MKKIISLFALISLFAFAPIGVKAQAFQMTGAYTTGDTVTNTGVKACSLKVVHSYKQITIAAELTKVSGTMGGTVTLLGSVDGTNFVNVDTALFVNGNGRVSVMNAAYTATSASGTQSKIWVINGTPYVWYKLSYAGTGTMVAILKGYLLPRELQ